MQTPRHAVATDGPAGSTAPGSNVPGSTAGITADDGPDRAWADLHRARRGNRPDAVAAAEDRAFRLYLPLARELASDFVGGAAAAPVEVEWAAELALAKAVLGWPGVDSVGFDAYAREAITARLRKLSSSHPHHRASSAQLSSMARRCPTGGRPAGH